MGRTPKINKNGGRDHWSRLAPLLLYGGGIRGGQVIGRTDGTASNVVERPVSVVDFLATLCRILGIDPNADRIPAGTSRPVAIVDSSKRAEVIAELF
jgi:arylsulfatase A-like enzyme